MADDGSTPRPDVAAALRKVPKMIKMSLHMSAGGDWRRVTVSPDGTFKVHNQPQVGNVDTTETPLPTAAAAALHPGATMKAATTAIANTARLANDLAPPRPAPAPPKTWGKPPAKPPAKLRPATPELLAHLAGTPVPTPAPATVTIVPAPPRPAREPERSPEASPEELSRFDWNSVDLEPIAHRLLERYRTGIPEVVRYTYHSEVLALHGMDVERCDDAIRHPQRTEIRAESYDKVKRYPILGFWRGDILAIVGFRDTKNPVVIAAYDVGLLLHDTHRVDHHGGGGRKKASGLPTTPKAAIRYLRILNCQIPDEPKPGERTVEVTYQGDSLGKITVEGNVPKATVETDFQRCLRRKHAIDRRLGVSA